MKTAYIENLLSIRRNYPPAAIEALIRFKKAHREGSEPQEARLAAMQELVTQFCGAYNMEAITVTAGDLDGGFSGASNYNPAHRIITMHGRLSIITLLHEFAHALPNVGHGEDAARGWSLMLFKAVYPRAYERLAVPQGGQFVLLRPESVPAYERDIAVQAQTIADDLAGAINTAVPENAGELPAPGTAVDVQA